MRIYVFVEGQTEEAFVDQVLAPHFADLQRWLVPIVVATSRDRAGKKHAGGANWSKWKNEIERLMRQFPGQQTAFTTMIDLYGLPSDFPSLPMILQQNTGSNKGRAAELAMSVEFQHLPNSVRFVPYVQVHEFEALVIANLQELRSLLDPKEYPGWQHLVADIGNTLPEDVNTGPQTAPSKRIQRHIPGFQKLTLGVQAAGLSPVGTLSARCPQFGSWLDRLRTV